MPTTYTRKDPARYGAQPLALSLPGRTPPPIRGESRAQNAGSPSNAGRHDQTTHARGSISALMQQLPNAKLVVHPRGGEVQLAIDGQEEERHQGQAHEPGGGS